MSTRTSARTTTLCMEPEEHVAETACVVLPKRYFIPNCPLAARPAQQRMYAEEARRRRPTTQHRADSVPPHLPPAWQVDGLSRPEHPRQRSHHLYHAQPGVSRPRAWCDGANVQDWSLGHGERRGRLRSSNGAAAGT